MAHTRDAGVRDVAWRCLLLLLPALALRGPGVEARELRNGVGIDPEYHQDEWRSHRKRLLADSDGSAGASDDVTAAPSPPLPPPPVVYTMIPRHVRPGEVAAPPAPPLYLPPRTPFVPSRWAKSTPTEEPEPDSDDSDGTTHSPTVTAPTILVDTSYTFAGGFSLGAGVLPEAEAEPHWSATGGSVILLLASVAAAFAMVFLARVARRKRSWATTRESVIGAVAAEAEPLCLRAAPPAYGASSASAPL